MVSSNWRSGGKLKSSSCRVMVAVDFVLRDGRVAERELMPHAQNLSLVPIDLGGLDGYSAAQRRSQLVEALWACARRSVAREAGLRDIPVLQPVAAAAGSPLVLPAGAIAWSVFV